MVAGLGCGSPSTVQTPPPATLQAIAISPTAVSVVAGKTQQYSAKGSNSDGSSKDLTNSVTWSSSNTSVVTISQQGLATTLTEGTATLTAALQSISGSTTLTATALTVEVSVTATDSGGRPLTYRWQSTDGMIQDVNASSTSWTLPNGPGLHFAYVLVSNGAGGYTERRIAVKTDTIGTPLTIPPPVSLASPPAHAPAVDNYRSFVNWGSANANTGGLPVPDIPVYLTDSTSGTLYPASGTVMTNLRGEFLIPGVPPLTSYKANCSLDGGNTFTNCTSVEPYKAWPPPPPPSAAATEPFNAAASSILLQCETAAPASVPVVNPNPIGMALGRATLAGVSAPVVSAMSATLNGTEVGTFLPPPSGLPSDFYPGADQFLAEKGSDTRVGACQYHKAIGAVTSCDASGNPSGAISFEDWKRTVKIDNYASGAPVYTATYVNKVDLNLTRNHHSVSYGANQTAAYVCNHLGPPTLNSPQSDIDTAVDNTVSGKNLVACVAMDNNVTPGVNVDSHGVAQPFTRFLIFGPSGQLLPSINLDQRREKFVPGTCVVCHGGDHYAGKFPEDGTGAADVGGHFLPYDTGNFEFSSKPGSTEADQEQTIYLLNQNLLNAAPTVAERELIAGWYAAGPVLDKKYLPASWQNQSANAISFYQNVHARSCRTCHVALAEGYNFDHYQNITPGGPSYRESSPGSALYESLSSNFHRRGHSMPNSLVTFNRFWQSAATSVDQPAILKQFFLADPTVPETTGNVTVIDGFSNTAATTITAGVGPLAVNSVTNKIYVPNRASNTVNVIDGAGGVVTASIPEGTGPDGMAVNPVTNKIYVDNADSNNVTVIDGVSDTVTATVSFSSSLGGLAVNSVTNKIYVTTGDISGTSVTVIDGASNTVTATVPFGGFVSSLAINSGTNKIYMTTNALIGINYIGNLIVIDGTSDAVVATIPLGGFGGALAINSVTNKVYVATSNISGNNVTVINGASNTVTATIPFSGGLSNLAVNAVTNKIYAPISTNTGGYNVTVINGVSDTVATTIPLGGFAYGLATNSVTNKIYVPIAIIIGGAISGYNVTVIDGASNTVIATVPVGLNPSAVTVNSVTNKVYVDVE